MTASVVVSNMKGETIRSLDQVPSNGGAPQFDLPLAFLAPGEYGIEVKVTSPTGVARHRDSVPTDRMMLQTLLPRREPWSYQLMRIVVGLVCSPATARRSCSVCSVPTDVAHVAIRRRAGIIEFVGGLLVAAGVAVTPVAFVCSGEMAVAFFQNHWPKGILANSEWWGARGALLLRLPLHLHARSAIAGWRSAGRRPLQEDGRMEVTDG